VHDPHRIDYLEAAAASSIWYDGHAHNITLNDNRANAAAGGGLYLENAQPPSMV
jgi:hypothetical protein